MIPLPPELEKAERDLLDRSITGSEASEIVFTVRKKLGPPWHWKSWKLARQKVLAKECATCGAGKKAILYLQHTFRNPRVRPYIEAAQGRQKLVKQDDWREDLRNRMYEIQDSMVPDMRNCCPTCKSLSIQYRKGAATWICNSKSNSTCSERWRKIFSLCCSIEKSCQFHQYDGVANYLIAKENVVAIALRFR